jgi:hemerythrin-like domain-containing protein
LKLERTDMQPTDILKGEHRVIEQVLCCLEKMAHQCGAGRPLDYQAAREALDFFKYFADDCHHAKEEDFLFPLLEAKGFSQDHGPTGVMLREHEQGRRYLCGMAGALEEAAQGDPAAPGQFAGLALGYVALLRDHIAKEDERLFPMADRSLTPADQLALLDAFARVEDAEMFSHTHEKYLRIANELARRYGVPLIPLEAVAGPGCCSCSPHG